MFRFERSNLNATEAEFLRRSGASWESGKVYLNMNPESQFLAA
jgi:hypothetical protein